MSAVKLECCFARQVDFAENYAPKSKLMACSESVKQRSTVHERAACPIRAMRFMILVVAVATIPN